MNSKLAAKIVARLKREYPDSCCSLDHHSPIQLVVATMLSAQSTDERVNLTTPALFRKYRSVAALAEADQSELEAMIRQVGLFRSKAKNIIAMAQRLKAEFNSRVPRTVTELQSLPGIGRKSANVILGEVYGMAEGIAVDTHVTRLSFRLGLTRAKDPKKIEVDLMKWIDRDDWVLISHLLIDHGRAVCGSRTPRCDDCALAELCPRHGVVA